MVKYLACCISCLILLVLLISIAGWAANAKKPHHPAPPVAVSPSERLGAADSWTAFDFREKSGKVADVVSFDEGYPLKDGSDVSLGIEGTKFQLFTKGGTAWARTPELDKAIVEAMAKGRQAVVRGTSQKGGATTDTYSLTGFAEALAMIDKACEIKR
jgi:Invasion associated locus B (IalB) protein